MRYRTGGTAISGRPELSDVIGHVRSVSPDDIQIERRDGTVATVRRTDAVTWKRVPDQRR